MTWTKTPDKTAPVRSSTAASKQSENQKMSRACDSCRFTYMESKLSREVVHAAGVHQTQGVPHRLGAQHALARDRADAAVCQGGRHDTGALAGHLNGTQLEVHTKGQLVSRLDHICARRVSRHGGRMETRWWGEGRKERGRWSITVQWWWR